MTGKTFRRSSFIAAAALVAAVTFAACQGGDTIDKFPDPGHVTVTVVDQNSALVAGALVALLLPENSFVWRSAVTDATGQASPGAAEGGILPGSYNVTVTPPLGYFIPNTQPNPVGIVVQSNKSIPLTFKLSKGS